MNQKDNTSLSSGIYSETEGLYNTYKSINVIHRINKMKGKNHLIISIDAEKAFDKIQHPFMIKTLIKSGNRGNIANIIRPCTTKPLQASNSMGKD